MNVLLLVILALSGLFEAIVGVWAIAAPTGFAEFWLRIPQVQAGEGVLGGVALLLFLLGLASLGLAALHGLAIYWLRCERRDAFHLSIALGVTLLVVGLATYFRDLLAGPRDIGATRVLLVDGLRGLALGLVGFFAQRAPATLRELRLPERRDRGRATRQDSVRDRRTFGDRDGRGRDRDRGRSRGRPVERRGEGRRSAEGPRRGGVGRPQGQRPGRGAERETPPRPAVGGRLESASGLSRGPSSEASGIPEDFRARPLNPREGEGSGGRDRWQQRQRSPQQQDAEAVRPLGVVVTGRPPVSGEGRTEPVTKGQRVEPPEATEERTPFPRAPMVPRVRVESLRPRPLSADQPQEDDRERGSGAPDRRNRRRRRPSRSGQDRPRLHGAEPRPRDIAGAPFEESDAERPRPQADPFDDGPAEPRRVAPPPVSVETERGREPRGFEASRDDESRRAAPPEDEPLDMLSAFGDRGEQGSAPGTRESAEFGRHRRPFTARRTNKQVKPRGTKVHQHLGGDMPKEAAPAPEDSLAEETRGAPPVGRIGMTDGIGPIDLSDMDADEPDSGKA